MTVCEEIGIAKDGTVETGIVQTGLILGMEGPDSFPGFEREKPSFVKSVYYNLTGGVKMKLKSQFGSFGQGYMTLALFILGLVIGRSRFFEEAQTRKGRNMVIFGGFVVALLALRYIMSLFTPSEASPAVGGGK